MNFVSRIMRATGFTLAGLIMSGCAGQHGTARHNSGHAQIQSRATNFFQKAVLLKPAAESPPGTLEPLILQEVGSAGVKPMLPGTLVRLESRWRVEPGTAAIYSHRDSVMISGQSRVRQWFLWFYPDDHGVGFVLRGVNMILDNAGKPVVWSVVNGKRAPHVIYVSESLEAKAVAHFGGALDGRRYAVEPGPDQAEDTVVARVLQDGPVAMGPIVYVSAEDLAISAVICRCMPSQVRELASTQTYVLLPWDLLANDPTFVAALKGSGLKGQLPVPVPGATPPPPLMRFP